MAILTQLTVHDVRLFGDLINAVAPIHVKKDSLVHKTIAKFVKMDGEVEDYTVSGSLLNNAGIKLHPKYSGCGYNGEVAYFADYCSRIYVMETNTSK